MPSSSPAKYRQYRDELNGSKTAESARVGTLVVLGLNTGFIALDWFTQADRFHELLAVRLAWDALMVVTYWALGVFDPRLVMMTGLYLSGLGMLSVIGLAGGAAGSYWPGMMILFLGIPVMLPLSVRQATAVVTILTAGFVGLPVFTRELVTFEAFLGPAFFVCGAGIECVASTAALERLRFVDFQQRRELETARDHLSEMDRLKARFTANVHHELRTPLTLTLAPLESLLAGKLGEIPSDQRSYLQTMHANALRLLKLINNLLDLAKAESSELTLVRRPTDIVRLVRDLVRAALPLAERRKISLVFESDRDSRVVNADPDALEKIAMNLVGNALKFTESGGAVMAAVRASGSGVELSVRDEGVGLEESELKRVFDRFAQVDSSASRKNEGTGIGLSLSQELVTLHGGRLWAESDGLGRGSTFRVWLPLGEADADTGERVLIDSCDARANEFLFEPELAQAESELEADGGAETADPGKVGWDEVRDDERRPTVLICEDNPGMRGLLRDLVGSEFNVRTARNGREGLESVSTAHPDLILTDVMMPEMSGVEMCRCLKQSPETRGIPIVLVTSRADREMKIAGLEDGADDYVTKPFHAEELMARIRSLLRVTELQQEISAQNRELENANTELSKAISDLKEAEAHLVHTERLAAVGELAAGIAHEVNNPVNFSRNAASAMKRYVDQCRIALRDLEVAAGEAGRGAGGESKDMEEGLDALSELAEIVEDGLSRTGTLVGDLRDFASPWRSTGGEVDVEALIRSSCQLVGYALQQRQVELTIELEEGIPSANGDRQAIGQVLLNLLTNAISACTAGGQIVVTATQAGEGVRLSVKDDGVGMSADVVSRVFDPFFSTKGPDGGTGLGLSISSRIVQEHGGEIAVTSEEGRGSEFVVWLPSFPQRGVPR